MGEGGVKKVPYIELCRNTLDTVQFIMDSMQMNELNL